MPRSLPCPTRARLEVLFAEIAADDPMAGARSDQVETLHLLWRPANAERLLAAIGALDQPTGSGSGSGTARA